MINQLSQMHLKSYSCEVCGSYIASSLSHSNRIHLSEFKFERLL
jgi:hypothetical protein